MYFTYLAADPRSLVYRCVLAPRERFVLLIGRVTFGLQIKGTLSFYNRVSLSVERGLTILRPQLAQTVRHNLRELNVENCILRVDSACSGQWRRIPTLVVTTTGQTRGANPLLHTRILLLSRNPTTVGRSEITQQNTEHPCTAHLHPSSWALHDVRADGVWVPYAIKGRYVPEHRAVVYYLSSIACERCVVQQIKTVVCDSTGNDWGGKWGG